MSDDVRAERDKYKRWLAEVHEEYRGVIDGLRFQIEALRRERDAAQAHAREASAEEKQVRDDLMLIVNSPCQRLECIDFRRREQTLRRERHGEVWIWQGNGEDKPESLTCPVLISAEDLRKLLAK